MSILGLMSTEQLKDAYSLNSRRRVFYQYPNGAAPLMGLLSLTDSESTDKTETGWHEDRFEKYSTKTAAGTTGPFMDADGADGADGTAKADPWAGSKGDVVRVSVDDASEFQARDQVQIRFTPTGAGGEVSFQGLVTAVWGATNNIDIELLEDVADIGNDAGDIGAHFTMVGAAAAEGDRSRTGYYKFPLKPTNYTQIFRHAFSFSRSALKAGLEFDSSGIYKSKAKKNSLKHMKALEFAAFFGLRDQIPTQNDDGEDSLRGTMGGLEYFIKQYEIGNTVNGGDFNYRPNGADISGADWRTEDDKRYIDVNGTITKDEFDNLNERMFRFTNDQLDEKLVLCGSGFLAAFNKYTDRESLRTVKLNAKDEAYGMNVMMWESPFGILYFKTHPLFTQLEQYRNSAFVIDMGNLTYRALNDSDTTLLKNRQPNDYDGRKDEWLTECTMEVAMPESHMFIDRLDGIVS